MPSMRIVGIDITAKVHVKVQHTTIVKAFNIDVVILIILTRLFDLFMKY